jgi:hypothetical protein
MIVTGNFSVLGYVEVCKERDLSWKCEELGQRFYQILKVYLKVLITSKVRA